MKSFKNWGRKALTYEDAMRIMEGSRIDEILASRTFAIWCAVVGSLFGLLGMAAAMVAVLVRETPAPVVYWAETGTPNVTIMRPLWDGKDRYDEVTNKAWLARYITLCEVYDWATIRTDSEACQSMSAASVRASMRQRLLAPDAPLKKLKDTGRVRVTIVSISFLPGGAAQVRYSKENTDLTGTPIGAPEKFIATLMFHYLPAVPLDERERLFNPLHFEVWGFRADPEVQK